MWGTTSCYLVPVRLFFFRKGKIHTAFARMRSVGEGGLGDWVSLSSPARGLGVCCNHHDFVAIPPHPSPASSFGVSYPLSREFST